MALLECLRAAAVKVLRQFVEGLALLLLVAFMIAAYGLALGAYVW